MLRTYSEPLLHLVFDAHWWASFVPPADAQHRETIDAAAMSDDAVMALFQ